MNDTNNNEEDQVDEDSGILIEEFIRITDPDSETVLYEGRA